MATTLTAWSVTGSGQLYSGATRLRGYQIATSGAASGIIQIRDGSVPPDLKYQAERLTKSVLRTGTGNNDVSAMVSLGMFPKGWMEMTRLTSTTAWFIKTNAPEGLKYLPRADDEPVSEGDFETDNLRVRGYFRCAFGWTNPQGLYGNQGA